DFAHHVCQLAAPLRAARHRNDAEGAPIIAATLHRHERRNRIVANGGDVLVVLPSLERDIGGTLTGLRLRDQLGQAAVAIGADDEIDLWDALEELGAKTLCHTADDAKHVARAFVTLELAHPSQDPLLG